MMSPGVLVSLLFLCILAGDLKRKHRAFHGGLLVL
jgi:hypothetical protein